MITVRDLRVTLPPALEGPDQPNCAVAGIDLDIGRGEVVGLVGESGSGKSMTALAIMRLLPQAAASSGSIRLADRELSSLSEREMCQVRGREIGLVFQDATAALNPVYSIGWQIREAVTLSRGLRGKQARSVANELFARVGLPAERQGDYPHELSGGMRQRAMIAMALAGDPKVLIADEPTTSLDLLAAAQIRTLLADLQRERELTLLVISHDLAMVGEIAHRIVVMYAGQVVEAGDAAQVLSAPSHPYTRALLAAIPPIRAQRKRRGDAGLRLPTIPAVTELPREGCRFRGRCPEAVEACATEAPELYATAEGEVRCLLRIDGERVA